MISAKTAAEKSCGPQLLDTDTPSKAWGIDRLRDYAREQHAAIIKREKTLAPCYWRLGHALNLIRPDFNRGQWDRVLKSLKIEKTRASKARAIHEAFASADELQGMSVEAAYKARRKPPEKEPGAAGSQPALSRKLGRALGRIDSVATQVFENVADLAVPDKQELLKTLRHTIARLEDHARQLEADLQAVLAVPA